MRRDTIYIYIGIKHRQKERTQEENSRRDSRASRARKLEDTDLREARDRSQKQSEHREIPVQRFNFTKDSLLAEYIRDLPSQYQC
uniref:Uncharacterized protein n=1 Tax=Arion vulgaris TaxID=1028688 RepID=A0A0B6ZX70_9EUPU